MKKWRGWTHLPHNCIHDQLSLCCTILKIVITSCFSLASLLDIFFWDGMYRMLVCSLNKISEKLSEGMLTHWRPPWIETFVSLDAQEANYWCMTHSLKLFFVYAWRCCSFWAWSDANFPWHVFFHLSYQPISAWNSGRFNSFQQLFYFHHFIFVNTIYFIF